MERDLELSHRVVFVARFRACGERRNELAQDVINRFDSVVIH
jgi:hypothetical protein